MNTDRGLLFLGLCLTCFYFVFDEFFGQKRISQWAAMLTPDIPSIGQKVKETVQKAVDNPEQAIEDKEKAKKKVKEDKDLKKNPDAQKEIEHLIDKFYGNPMT